jgi:dTDP-glucose 4,6-dehydratase
MAMTHIILSELGAYESMIDRVRDRPAHDRRYAVDFTKIREELNWQPTIDFEQGLRGTVQWYREHVDWWRAIQTGAYMDYIEAQYGSDAR